MKIGAAQIKIAGDSISASLEKHVNLIQLAADRAVNFVLFPELSIPGYSLELPEEATFSLEDARLAALQAVCDARIVSVCVGAPTQTSYGKLISMFVLKPGQVPTSYSKQLLHEDETPYYVPGEQQLLIDSHGYTLAPAICFESVQSSHAAQAHKLGTNVYLASVAKGAEGLERAYQHYSNIAQRHAMTIVLANSIGDFGDFKSCGGSAVWHSDGQCAAVLNHTDEGIVGVDFTTDKPFALKL